MQQRKTKIICTMGPATDDPSVLREMLKSGMDVARMNFSHGTHEEHKMRIDELKEVRKELGMFIPIMLDTKGPEIRIGLFEGGKAELVAGQTFTLTTEEVMGNREKAYVTYDKLPEKLAVGNRVLIDDGLVELEVVKTTKTDVVCVAINGGVVKNRKGVNVPDISIDMPYMSARDRDDIIFGIEMGVDFVAASFVRNALDVMEVRKVLEQNGGRHIQVIAKIENKDGIKNIDEILKVSDGIMVARGDMGVEISIEDLPRLQKMIIKKCFKMGKKAITATQMLESMIDKPRPTRAEVTDVANAIYDGTSAMMLSAESAVGAYPVESVKTMANIAVKTEASIDYQAELKDKGTPSVTNAISHATCTTAYDLGAAAIITVTESGNTARLISSYRPKSNIIAATTQVNVARQLNMSWGVTPVLAEMKNNSDELFEHAIDLALSAGHVENGDIVVLTGGVPLGVSGTTNILKVDVVGHILCQGKGVNNQSACATLCVAKNAEEARKNFNDGDILVIPSTGNEILDILKKASGIITEEEGVATHAVIVGMTLDIPVITGAKNATKLLKSGTTVTMDGTRGSVYSGIAKVADLQ